MRTLTVIICACFMASMALGGTANAQEKLKPYMLVSEDIGALAAVTGEVKEKLAANDLELVGEYSPREGSQVLVVTCDALKATAAKTDFGGYGAAIRVGLTQVGEKVQVAYLNPTYLAYAYRMEDGLAPVLEKLQAALGAGTPFGAKKGFTEKTLRKYHYMVGMPYFNSHIELAKHDSHEAAVAAVEKGLKAGAGDTAQVYKVAVTGKDEIVYGVAIKVGNGADSVVMNTCDLGTQKHTAYAPYELLVSGNKVYALHARFRIALSFPDLGMGTFTKIISAPGAIQASLRAAANPK